MEKSKNAVLFSEYGSADKLFVRGISLPTPAAGEVQIEQSAIGVNFIDIYHRQGMLGANLPLPSGLGMEGVGVITAVGPDVTDFHKGDRIAYAGGPLGGYATHRNLPISRALKLPDDLTSETVAAMMFKGLTAEYLIHRCVDLKAGDTVLFQAAAGGVGSIACQWLNARGIKVIGTVSTAQKAKIARSNGCDTVINYSQEDFQERVAEITDSEGVAVVFDSVGADTFAKSLDCLQPRGTLVSFGQSSGPVPLLDVASLGAKGSLYITRPSVAHYTADRNEMEAAAQRLFAAMADGTLKPPHVTTYPLEQAARAHSDLEARLTSGSVILLP